MWYNAAKSTYALSMIYIAPGTGTRTSSTLLSWYLPSVIRIKEGMLPLRSNNVWTFMAPREYFPGAQLNSFRLREIVVESRANTSFSTSIFGIRQFTYIRSEEHTSELQSLMRISYA